MGIHYGIISTFLLLVAHLQVQADTLDVTKYGAKPNQEISQALSSAWNDACAAETPTTILIPKDEYWLNAVKLQGPCKAPVQIELQGTVKAPSDPADFKDRQWVAFYYMDSLTLSGGGSFDGNGQVAWDCKRAQKPCASNLPLNIGLNFLNNSIVHNVTSLNSKEFHIKAFACHNLTFQHMNITAPGDSPNTDGIHIGKSTNVNVIDTTIATGDDCVSTGDGIEEIYVKRVTCGPGHGISIGSLGGHPNEEPVRGVYVENCTFINTDNGVRIKTWPNAYDGMVSDIHYKDIIVQNVKNPVVVDQNYCPYNLCDKRGPSKVRVRKLSYENIRGTSATEEVFKLDCSKSLQCTYVTIGDIDLEYVEGKGKSVCNYVKRPFITGKQHPHPCSS